MRASLRRYLWPSDKHVCQERWVFVTLLVGATVGLLASFVLSVEAITLAANKHAVLSCSINAVLNCASVGVDSSAHVLGFPNAFTGMMSMSVLVTIAMVALMGGKLSRSFMYCAQWGAVAGLAFAAWMFYMSYSVIRVLCPWCLTTDVAMVIIFYAITRYNIINGNLYLLARYKKPLQSYVAKDYDKVVMILVAVVAAVLIFAKFGKDLF